MDRITTPLGELAAQHPSATRVFMRHRLDFCCGRRRSLREACERAGLDPDAILAELDQEATRDAGGSSPERLPQSDLADHIESVYHAGLRRDLPTLIEAARKVERVHAGKPAVPAGLAAVLDEFLAEMESHMAKEERILFPMIRRGGRGETVYMPVRMMEREHDSHAEQLANIRELTCDLQAPDHACATWRALYHGLETLEADLMRHIHLENNVLFARATQGQ
jgi:regulator of cell morphogenesis and NO signaling